MLPDLPAILAYRRAIVEQARHAVETELADPETLVAAMERTADRAMLCCEVASRSVAEPLPNLDF